MKLGAISAAARAMTTSAPRPARLGHHRTPRAMGGKGRQIGAGRALRSLRRRNELESGLDEEIRFHIDRQTEKNVRAGMEPVEARRQALIKFGGVARARESTRDGFRLGPLENFLRHLW